MAAAVVANGSANVLGNDGAVVGQQLFQRLVLQIGRRFQRLVQVVDVAGMMLAVMDFHGLFVDVGFERVERVRKRGNCKCHSCLLLSYLAGESSGFFESVGKTEHARLVEVPCQNLHAHRRPAAVFPHGTLMHGMPARSPVMV